MRLIKLLTTLATITPNMKRQLFECVGENQFKLKPQNQLLLESGKIQNWLRKVVITGVLFSSLARGFGADVPNAKTWNQLSSQEKQTYAQKATNGNMEVAKDFYEAEQELEKMDKAYKSLAGLSGTTSAGSKGIGASADAQSQATSKMGADYLQKKGIPQFNKLTEKEKEEWNTAGGEQAYTLFMVTKLAADKTDATLKLINDKHAEMQKASDAYDKLMGTGTKHSVPATSTNAPHL